MAAERADLVASTRVTRVQLGLAGAGLAATAAAIVAALAAVRVTPAGGHEVAIAGVRLSYPSINAAAVVLLALASLGAAVAVVAARCAWREIASLRAFLGDVRVIGGLPGHAGVKVIDDSRAQAFCAGYLRPHVYVSTGAIERLEPAELAAVLAHEQHHRAAYDPLRLACGRVLSRALFFLPALRPLHERHSALSELRADAAAVRTSGDSGAALASAMLRFGDAGSGELVGISPERVDGLLGEAPAAGIPSLLVAAALATVAAVAALTWRVSAAAAVRTSLAPPLLSSKPCVLVLALVPVLAALMGLAGRQALRR